mmetsp:Transcript_47377/g.119395  ORF Transcript_47377/g.119395 Transcript_47377/m.119395 type:complete len:208 (-) Transcript_47377:297-920(-)
MRQNCWYRVALLVQTLRRVRVRRHRIAARLAWLRRRRISGQSISGRSAQKACRRKSTVLAVLPPSPCPVSLEDCSRQFGRLTSPRPIIGCDLFRILSQRYGPGTPTVSVCCTYPSSVRSVGVASRQWSSSCLPSGPRPTCAATSARRRCCSPLAPPLRKAGVVLPAVAAPKPQQFQAPPKRWQRPLCGCCWRRALTQTWWTGPGRRR